MSRKTTPDSPSTHRTWLLIGATVVLFLTAMIVALRKDGTPQDDPRQTTQLKRDTTGKAQDPSSSDPAGSDRPPRERRQDRPATPPTSPDDSDPAEDEPGPRFPMVDAILGDDSLPAADTAQRLLEIASNEQAPEAERLDALAHGLNLDFATFLPLASNPKLPTPMAERLLHEIANQGDLPAAQLQGCLGLLDHPDETVQSQAVERLAFLLGDESENPPVDTLRTNATRRIQELATNPPASPSQEEAPAENTTQPESENPPPPAADDTTGPVPDPPEP